MPAFNVFTKATQDDQQQQQPFGRILASIMRGSAAVQGQEQAKAIASDQLDAPSPVVTMKANPSGGPPLVTIKDIAADALNGTQGSDVKKAYDTPRANVERKIGQMEGAGIFSSAAGNFPKYRTDYTGDNVGFNDVYQKDRDAGHGVIGSAIGAALTKAHIFSPDAAAADIDRSNFSKNFAVEKAIRTEDREDAQVQNTRTGHALQMNQQYLMTRDKLLDQKNVMAFPTEDAYVSAATKAMEGAGGAREGDADLFRQAYKTGRVSFLNDRIKEANTPEGRSVAASYGQTDDGFKSWVNEAVGVPPESIDPYTSGKMRKTFNALQDQHVTDTISTARKEGALGSFVNVDEAKTAYGIDKVTGTKEKEFDASYNAARRAYLNADSLERAKIDAARMNNQKLAEQVNGAPPIPDDPKDPRYTAARDLAYGDLTFQQFGKLYSYSRDANAKLAIYNKAREINPNFNSAKLELGYKFAANSKVRQQVASADNALRLIPEAIGVSDLAARSGSTAVNKLINKVGIALGGQTYTNLATMQNAFADELSGALGFGSATDMTRSLGLKMADFNLSSPNFRSSMAIVKDFVEKKRGTLLNQMGDYAKDVNDMSGNTQAPTSGPVLHWNTKTKAWE